MSAQVQIINKVLQTRDYSLIEKNNISEDFFFTYKAEFNYIKNHYKQYQVVPDKFTFLNVFPDWDIIEVNEPDSYLLEQLQKEYAIAAIATGFNNAKGAVESNNVDAAIEVLKKTTDGIKVKAAMTCTSLKGDLSRYDRYLDRVTNHDNYYISTGFKELDDIIGGIDIENENMVIAARTGVGKTWTLLAMAAAGAREGKTVGIYSGEMTADKVFYRIDTLLGNINNTVITRGTDASAQRQYKQYLENIDTYCPGDIKVITPNDINGPATVDAIQAFIEKEGIEEMLIDQYSLLEDTSHAKAGWERVGNISKAVKNLQVMKRIPIISVSQMNRDKNEDGTQDTTQIGLADRIGQDATTIIMLERKIVYEDEKEKTRIKDDKLILNVVKSRDGGTGKLEYHADFNNGRFVYLDPKATVDASYYETPTTGSSGSGNNVF
jgi:replicative DNA helicase